MDIRHGVADHDYDSQGMGYLLESIYSFREFSATGGEFA
jgi:hypothetical protein